MIEQALLALLQASPAIAALLGARIFPAVIPEGTPLPALTYRVISLVDVRTLDREDWQRARFEFEVLAATYAEAAAAALALYELLDDWSGPLSPNPFSSAPVADITRDSQRSGFDHEQRLFFVQTDWLVEFSS